MIEQNRKEFEFLGILEWWNSGYTGKGIKIGNLENVYPLKSFGDRLKIPFEYQLSSNANIHGQKTMDVLHQVAPDAELYPLANGGDRFANDTVPFILSKGIDIVNASLGGSEKDDKNILIENCIDKGSIFVTSAGNSGSDGLGAYARSPLWISVGAVHYTIDIIRPTYSSIGGELDVVSFSNLSLIDGRNESNLIHNSQGTSFSSPLLAGMLALVQQYFVENAGKKLNKDQMEQFIIDNVMDLGTSGHDEYYGHGLFILPDPNNIDIEKYVDLRNSETPHIEESDEMVFKDTGTHWAKQEIDFVSEQKIMNGFPDGTFQPDKTMTRAEVATVIARMMGFVKK